MFLKRSKEKLTLNYLEISLNIPQNELMKLLILLLLSFSSFGQRPILLLGHHKPPFVKKVDGKYEGEFLKALNCTLKKMDVEYEIRIVPWKRAQVEAKEGRAEGFFAASDNRERNEFATLSEVFGKQTWSFYFLKDNAKYEKFIEDRKFDNLVIGAYYGSNMKKDLEGSGYEVNYRPGEPKKLFDGLLKGRVDTILASEHALEIHIPNKMLRKRVKKVPYKDKNLGVYFTNKFLKTRPGFLNEFDDKLKTCIPKNSKYLITD